MQELPWALCLVCSRLIESLSWHGDHLSWLWTVHLWLLPAQRQGKDQEAFEVVYNAISSALSWTGISRRLM